MFLFAFVPAPVPTPAPAPVMVVAPAPSFVAQLLSSFTFADALTLISLLAPVLFYLGKRLLERLPAHQQEVFGGVVQSVVTAVEQMMQTPGSGQLKKQEASKLIAAELARLHIKTSPDQISVAIECAVKAMHDAAAADSSSAGAAPVGFAPPAPAPAPAPAATTTSAPEPAPVPASAGIVGLVARPIH